MKKSINWFQKNNLGMNSYNPAALLPVRHLKHLILLNLCGIVCDEKRGGTHDK